MTDAHIKEYLDGIIGTVEANTFEQNCLWRDYHEKYEWIETRSGYIRHVGEIGDKPIYISLMTAIIKGHKILFWYPTSVAVDYDVITEWLKKNVPQSAMQPNADYVNNVDAQNFSNVFHYVNNAEFYFYKNAALMES
jgi:hypothetical protein